LSGFAWLFVGIAVGAAHGGLLWHAVQGLQPGSPAGISAARLVCAGWARNLGVALVLLLTMQRGLAAGLWALLGMLLARFIWIRRVAS